MFNMLSKAARYTIISLTNLHVKKNNKKTIKIRFTENLTFSMLLNIA